MTPSESLGPNDRSTDAWLRRFGTVAEPQPAHTPVLGIRARLESAVCTPRSLVLKIDPSEISLGGTDWMGGHLKIIIITSSHLKTENAP